MTEQEFDSRVRQMEGKMYRIARSMLRSDPDCGDALHGGLSEVNCSPDSSGLFFVFLYSAAICAMMRWVD